MSPVVLLQIVRLFMPQLLFLIRPAKNSRPGGLHLGQTSMQIKRLTGQLCMKLNMLAFDLHCHKS
jgi:hypothetical protein